MILLLNPKDRLTKMLKQVLKNNPGKVKDSGEFWRKTAILTDYMDSGQWLADYEADYEAGEIAHKKEQRDIVKL